MSQMKRKVPASEEVSEDGAGTPSGQLGTGIGGKTQKSIDVRRQSIRPMGPFLHS